MPEDIRQAERVLLLFFYRGSKSSERFGEKLNTFFWPNFEYSGLKNFNLKKFSKTSKNIFVVEVSRRGVRDGFDMFVFQYKVENHCMKVVVKNP